jgi:hypothetical protein
VTKAEGETSPPFSARNLNAGEELQTQPDLAAPPGRHQLAHNYGGLSVEVVSKQLTVSSAKDVVTASNASVQARVTHLRRQWCPTSCVAQVT